MHRLRKNKPLLMAAKSEAFPIEKKLQLGAFLVSLVIVAIGVYQYSDTKEKEFKKGFYEERFRTYTELSETIAKIATLQPNSNERAAAVERYWQLVFGKVHLVGDAEVQNAVRNASKWVVFCVEKKAVPPDKELCNVVAGNANAINISEAARNSLVRTWNVPLEKLNESDLYPKPRS